MKKMTMAVGVLTLGATLAFAAPHAGKFHGSEGKGKARAFAQLDLTDAQKQQIEEIRKSSREANKAFFESARATREEYRAAKKAGDTAKAQSLEGTMTAQRAQMQQIREAEHAKIAAILTPDQRVKFDAMKKENGAFGPGSKGERRKGMGHAAHGGMMHGEMMHGEMMMGSGDGQMQARMAAKLNLTDAQKQQFDAIHKATREQNAAFFESMKSLRGEMHAARKANDTAKLETLKPRMEAQRAEMQKIRENMHAQISAILTPEQRTEFDRMQQKKESGRKGHGGMHGKK